MLEEVFAAVPEGGAALDTETLARTVQKRMPLYDKAADGHYNLISALHKSVRGSDPDAALYYLARMLWPARTRCSSPAAWCAWRSRMWGWRTREALHQALAAKETYDFLGSPEGELAHRAGRRLRRYGAEIERALHRLQGGDASAPSRPAR